MNAEAWVATVSVAAAILVAIVGGCGAWMMGVYRKLGAIEQGFSNLQSMLHEHRTDQAELWSSHNALANRVTRLEAQS